MVLAPKDAHLLREICELFSVQSNIGFEWHLQYQKVRSAQVAYCHQCPAETDRDHGLQPSEINL